MQVELRGDTERIVREEMSSRGFASPEAVVEEAIRFWSNETVQRRSLFSDPDELFADFWPEDETADDIIEFVQELRREHTQSVERRLERLP